MKVSLNVFCLFSFFEVQKMRPVYARVCILKLPHPNSIHPLHWVALSDLGLYVDQAGVETIETCLPLPLYAGINIKGQRTVLLKHLDSVYLEVVVILLLTTSGSRTLLSLWPFSATGASRSCHRHCPNSTVKITHRPFVLITA